MEYLISQLLVLMAYLLVGVGLRREKKIDLLIYSSLYHVLMAVHYVLLLGYLGALSSTIGLIRNIIFIYNERRKKQNSRSILIIFSVITVMLTVFFYAKPADILPAILALIGLYVYWCTNMKVVRLGNICISICYILYAISLKSWFTIVCEMYLIINTLIGYFKHEHKAKNDKKVAFK